MSFNQSTYKKNDHHPPPPLDPLNTGRSPGFNPQLSYSKGGAPSPSRSFKKSGGNATVAGNAHQQQQQQQSLSQTHPQLQSRIRTQPNPSPSASTLHAPSPQQPPEVPSLMAQPFNALSNRSTRPAPKPPTSRVSPMSSDMGSPSIPVKGDASKISVQFGSITPGFVNGMQVPARTSSAPPNLDEQRRDQAGHDPMKSNPPVPLPVAPKQQLPKNMGGVDKTMEKRNNAASKAIKDQVLPIASATVLQKQVVHPMPGPIPFHQSPVPLQFNGPNQQIQSQGPTATPIQYPISLPIPPSVQQQMFVPGLQPHVLQPHPMMHQGPGLNFGAPISSQLPQLGNLGMGVSSYSSPQGPKFGGPRKSTVRITHPKTHQEVRLDKKTDTFVDGSSSTRANSNFPPQSQPIAPYGANHSVNFYPNYAPAPRFFPPAGSVPLASSQITPNSQAPRLNHNVSHGPQTIQMENSQDISVPHNKGGGLVSGSSDSARLDHAHAKMHSGLVVAQGTLKPETGFASDNVTDISPKISATVKNIEPSGVSRNYAGSPSDSCILPSDTSLKQKPVSGSTVSLLGKTKEVAPASGDVSISDGSPSIRNMNAVESPTTLISNALSEAEGRGNDLMMSNLKDGEMILGEKGQNPSDSKVHEGSSGGSNSKKDLKGSTRFSSECPEESIAATESISSAVVKASDASDSADDTAVLTPVNHEHSRPDDANIKGELLSGVAAKPELEHSHPTERHEDSADQSEISSASLQCSESAKATDGEVRSRQSFEKVERTFDNHSVGSERCGPNEQGYCLNHDKGFNNSLNSGISGSIPCNVVSSLPACDSPSLTDTSTAGDITTGSDVGTGSAFGSNANLPEIDVGSMGSLETIVLKDTSALDALKAKSFASKGKKKRREFLQKADAAGATSDLYLAYKGPEDNKEVIDYQNKEIASPDNNLKNMSSEGEGSVVSEDCVRNKAEPDDWEDVADISTTKLESANAGQLSEASVSDDQTGCPVDAKKYSRDFLLKFVDKCRNLPETFVVTSDIVEAFIPSLNSSYVPNRDSHHSPGRVDRQSGGPRLDRRLSGLTDDDKWSKLPGPFAAGQNMHLDVGFGMNVGIRPGHGGNHGVLRNPRVQTPVPYISGLLSGPMQSLGSQGGLVRNSPDADRWQRAAGFQQKGLIPSPHTPLQVMHKAERKYEVGKITDEEEAKQRQLKAILNKLTPQNFEKLFEQVKAVNIDNAITLQGLISQIFDKALMEPTFCEMYADLCCHLAQELPDFSDDNEKITFKRLLLNKCQEEFERGEREQEEADKVIEEGEVKLSEDGREEKRINARRRMLGNIRLIGELYKKKMLTEKIMHECIKKLLGQHQTPHEEDIEALCKLMSTIGQMIDHPKARGQIDIYFDRMQMLANNMSFSSRVRFMLKDSIELRKRKWQQRRKVEGPKKIEDVHRDAAQERQAQAGRLGSRTTATNPSARRADFSSRVSNVLSSPATPIGGFHGSQVRRYGNQDVWFGEGQHYDARPVTVPLPQRHMVDDSSITLGPQGGLSRGMSFRGQPSYMLNSGTDTSSTVDSQRLGTGLNGLSLTENTRHGSRADTLASTERFPGRPAENQYRMPNSDDSSAVATLPSSQGQDRASSADMFEKKWPEERLRDMSIAAIREFYSAKDENEIGLCIKDLKSVSFYPSMVSLWVTDSFERKAMERDLLANLLVNLTRPQDGILSQVQLIKGFESALQSLEDAVNDAPKAPEFIGRIFGKAIAENTVSLRDIGQVILKGGEEPGGLLEAGLAVVVLESTLEMIKSLKGETVLDEVWTSSNLRLGDFRPSDPLQSKLLGRFM